MFENGIRNGHGKMSTQNGDYIECNWKDGKPDGKGWIKKGYNALREAHWRNGTLLSK